jgi:hypothetical protein
MARLDHHYIESYVFDNVHTEDCISTLEGIRTSKLSYLPQREFCFSDENLNHSRSLGLHFDSRGCLNAMAETEDRCRVLEVALGHGLKDSHVHGN